MDEIARDAAGNIIKLTEKILGGKEPEKNIESLTRIKSLRHEISLCMEEADFIRQVPRDEASLASKELARLDKLIGFAEKAAESKEAAEALKKSMDADYFDYCISSARENTYDLCDSRFSKSAKVRWYCPASFMQEPHNPRNTEQGPLMDNMAPRIKELVCGAQTEARKTLNIMISRANYEPSAITGIKDELGENVRIYGLYDSPTLLTDRTVRLKMEKCAFGDPRDYQISNNAFDVIYSRVTSSLAYGNYNSVPSAAESRITKDLKRFWRYLAPGGILFLLVPKFCMRQKERLTASGYYSFVWDEKANCPSYPELDLRLIALRKETTITDEEKEASYQALTAMEPSEKDHEKTFESLPKEDLGPIRMMKGPEEDLLIVEIALENSTLKIKKEKHETRNIEPLLPLKKGQIGQIIASGRLNGVIDEGDGFKHIISGRVVKGSRRRNTQDYSDPEHAVEETIITRNNMIEINALGGDGEIRTISMAVQG